MVNLYNLIDNLIGNFKSFKQSSFIFSWRALNVFIASVGQNELKRFCCSGYLMPQKIQDIIKSVVV